MNTPRSWTSTACLLAGLALLVGQGAQAEERIALVIGNGAYNVFLVVSQVIEIQQFIL